MPDVRVNGVRLAYEIAGEGETLVLVHGSWGNRHNWAPVFEPLARSFRVLRYDRRGHSESERPASQGSFEEDADDLAALIEALGPAPVHVVGNSGGAAIALKLAAKRPGLFRSLAVHEPPSFRVVRDAAELAPMMDAVATRIENVVGLLTAGRVEDGARAFVEQIAFGPGMWPKLPEALRNTFVSNAPTFLDETRDPDGLDLDLGALARFDRSALLTFGDASPPFFRAVVDRVAAAMPRATRFTFAGAGHVPHLTHPADYVQRITGHARAAG
jgi:pimeloyl-ACP methyl ester carboxylesterase